MAAEKQNTAKASAKVQESLAKLEVNLVGVASLRDLKTTTLGKGTLKLLPSARSIVVVAMEIYPEFLELTSPERTMGAPT